MKDKHKTLICFYHDELIDEIAKYKKLGWTKVGKVLGEQGLYFQEMKIKKAKLKEKKEVL